MQGLFEKGVLVSVLQSFIIVFLFSFMTIISNPPLVSKNKWYPSNTTFYQALGLPLYCTNRNSRHLEYLLTWELSSSCNSWPEQQKASIWAAEQPGCSYCHNRLRNTLCSPEELNRQKTLGWDVGDETFSISSWAENAPRARAGVFQTASAKRHEAQEEQSSSTWCWWAAPLQSLEGSETVGREGIMVLKLKLQAAFPWQCWDIAWCFIIIFQEPPPSCPNFQLTVEPFPVGIANIPQTGQGGQKGAFCIGQ